MIYILLVNELPRGYEEGHYSRVKEGNKVHSLTSKLNPEIFSKKGVAAAATVVSPILAVPSLLNKISDSKIINKINELQEKAIDSSTRFLYDEEYNNLVRVDDELRNWDLGGIIIKNENLNNNYNLEPNSFFGNVFECVPNFNSDAFRILMQSGGGSELIILKKSRIPRSFHHSGEVGQFSTGLYISHPKLANKLIPLKGSTDFIKDLILDEIITILSLLGAKKIVIMEANETKKSSSFNLSFKYKGINGGQSQVNSMTMLMRKEFGENGMDIERARKSVVFTGDLPKFMTILKAREHGNQLYDKFEETVEINAGLEASVVSLIDSVSASKKYSFKRYWNMEIEFYDKKYLQESQN